MNASRETVQAYWNTAYDAAHPGTRATLSTDECGNHLEPFTFEVDGVEYEALMCWSDAAGLVSIESLAA